MSKFFIQPLDPAIHRREEFDCGVEALNRYLREQAGQDMRRLAAGCWVLVAVETPETVLGYYTLSTEGIEAKEFPESSGLQKKLPRYPRLGAVLLGRLAVSSIHSGKGFGQKLLFDAISRCADAEIPAPLMLVDAKDAAADAFYRKYGFESLKQNRLFFAMHALRAGLESPGSHR
jgi:predicted GNAT family N-acyltransferase